MNLMGITFDQDLRNAYDEAGKRIMLDKLKIITRLRLKPEALQSPEQFADQAMAEARQVNTVQGAPNFKNKTLMAADLMRYGGIHCEVKQDEDASRIRRDGHRVELQFNPGACYYGHNGRIITEGVFRRTLSGMVDTMSKYLSDPTNDSHHLVPGLEGSHAYWDYVEIPLHLEDPERTLLRAFRSMRHSRVRVPPRHWHTSIDLRSTDKEFQICIYNKAEEFKKHKKGFTQEEFEQYKDVLRFEVRLSGSALVEYFRALPNSENSIRKIDGANRLVKFTSEQLAAVHRTVFKELKGVYHSTNEKTMAKAQDSSIAKFLAQVIEKNRHSECHDFHLGTLYNTLCHYFPKPQRRTIRGYRDNAEVLLGSLVFEQLFSDDAYHRWIPVVCAEIENNVKPLDTYTFEYEITEAYKISHRVSE